jgi:hypothetical protein
MTSWRPVQPSTLLVGPSGPRIAVQWLAARLKAPLVSPKTSIRDPVHTAIS